MEKIQDRNSAAAGTENEETLQPFIGQKVKVIASGSVFCGNCGEIVAIETDVSIIEVDLGKRGKVYFDKKELQPVT